MLPSRLQDLDPFPVAQVNVDATEVVDTFIQTHPAARPFRDRLLDEAKRPNGGVCVMNGKKWEDLRRSLDV